MDGAISYNNYRRGYNKMASKNKKKEKSKTKDDYTFCSVCRKNHNDRREGHIFSKKHQTELKLILDKFNKKVHSARCLLQKPNIVDGDLEPGITVWCYSCQEEINKHISDGFTTVEWGGLLEHMTSESHHKKTRYYCWENGIKKSQMQNLIIYQAELDKFKELVAEKLDKLNANRNKRLKESAKEIEEVEEAQQKVVAETRVQKHFASSACASVSDKIQVTASKRGNIHTGATPPWLLNDDEDEEEEKDNHHGGICYKHPIGPSEDDFLHWRDQHGKGKRNPKRIGANFHSNLRKSGQLDADNPKWLPSYGGVWNAGPRSHTKMEFESKLYQSSQQTKEQTIPLVVQPYVSKRKRPYPES
ncbi:PREDICTED: coiled-coil domain-containing protein 84-like isoform X2 [Amphimedon queenslandica]|uniref:Coiled-coil domain-containing protein 84 n=2 Tax=Amphimedon queenslandica TaxID=400682 RepID=A0AAN0IF07_AMPQE|nr:PREDICTED: coiled-coil domain-containing protein 84-like isoform X2 [Amphimedon queenslandica]|eukprot:XP_003387089.2 PREDICTED: coiled-coil domain-containing protein 84-like isoform X2 [Amphimedon queenslandica]